MFRKGSISALRYHCARPIPIRYRTITCQKIRMSASGPVQQLMIDYQSRYPIRAKSLIATIFGDAVMPHGGVIWLGSLIKLAAPFGINERLVRTAVYRLAKEDWLHVEQVGRRSFYRLSEHGAHAFESADRRIYGRDDANWDGRWRLAVINPAGTSARQRELLRREFIWLGCAPIAPGVFAHPTADQQQLSRVAEDLGLPQVLVTLTADGDTAQQPRMQALFTAAAQVESLATQYREFVVQTDRLGTAVDANNGEQAFVLRTLLIHEFRRVLLRDPSLPRALLPADWPGIQAREMTSNWYQRLASASEMFLTEHARSLDAPYQAAEDFLRQRFK